MENAKLNTITGEASCLTVRLKTSSIKTCSVNLSISGSSIAKSILLILLLIFGCSKKKEPIAPDTIPPVIKTVVSLDTTKLFISFSEELKPTFMLDTLNYFITSYETLDVHLVDIDPMKKNCVLTTEPQESTYYNIEIKNIVDVSGNVMKDTTLSFLGIGVAVDSFPPNVRILEPLAGDTLYGFEYFSVNATDNTGVRKVYFYLNDSLLEKDKYFPYYCIFDVRGLIEGNTYTIYASAVDYSANFGYSESLDVFVGYHPPFPYVVIDDIYTRKVPFRADKTEDGTKIFFVQVHDWNQPLSDDLVMLNTETDSIERAVHFYTGASYFLDVFGNDWVYFTTGNSFSIYDIALDQIIKTVDVGGQPQGIVRSSYETLYIARHIKEDILVYSLPLDSMVDSISLVGNPTVLAIDTVHNELYVGVYSQNLVSVIDITTNTIKANIPLSGTPFEVIFSPDYERAYVSEMDNNSIAVIDASNNTLLDELSWNGLAVPKGMAITADGEHLYATGASDKVFVINTFDYSVEWSFGLGTYPWSVVYIPLFDRMYVVCMGNYRVYCIGK